MGSFDLFWFIIGLLLGYLGIPVIVGMLAGKKA